jgi:hypothetical protein
MEERMRGLTVFTVAMAWLTLLGFAVQASLERSKHFAAGAQATPPLHAQNRANANTMALLP